MKCKNLLLFALLFLGNFFTADAQSGYTCEPNLDFELGNYTKWNYYRGRYTGGGTVSMTACPPDTRSAGDGLHELQGLVPGATDYYGGFPVVGDGVYSMRVGKDSPNNSAAAVDFHVHVPSCPSGSCTYSLIYRYAVVFEDPGHGTNDQPSFMINVKDSATSSTLPCNTFTFVSSSVLPGFQVSTVGSRPNYKAWSAGSLDMTSFAGKTIIVTFTSTGCNLGGHWGYGYCDMNCGIFKIQTVGCAGGFAELEGPPGYASYVWTDSLTYTKSYGTTVKVIVGVPTVTTTFALIINPYSGYGCPDTLYARLVPSNMVAHGSRDTSLCFGDSVRVWAGTTDILPLTFAWLPTTGVRCPTCDTTWIKPPVGLNHYKVTSYNTGGCQFTDTIDINVYPAAAPIGMPPSTGRGGTDGLGAGTAGIVCLGTSLFATESVVGGSWTTSSTTITIGSSTGLVTGVAVGTGIITYSFKSACPVFRVVTVTALPVPITGPSVLCVGLTATLSDAAPGGGTWTSATTAVATVGSSSGIVTGIFPGTSDIIFTSKTTGCEISQTETVISVPTVAGKPTVCQYSTTSYGGTPLGGTWSSSNIGVGTIDATTGALYAVSPGSTTLTYTVASGCNRTLAVTVIASPDPITGSQSICAGSCTSLSDASPGGVWSSSSTADATVGSTGTVCGSIAVVAPKVVTISYAYPTTCKATYTVTVNPVPATPAGTKTVCVGQTTSLSSTPTGGTWSATLPATVSGSPTAMPVAISGSAAGTSIISYTLSTGCYATTIVTVNPNPAIITGNQNICVGGINCFSDATTGGSWSIGNPSLGAIVPTTGCVTGLLAGTTTVTYKLTSSSCYSTIPVTVNAKPTAIGPSVAAACVGATLQLTDATSGGVWSSTNVAVGTIDASGIVTAKSAGTTTISYTIGGCPSTVVFTANANPGPIAGPTALCAFATATLTATPGGGTWSSVGGNITIGSTTGKVTAGATPGCDVVTYRMITTGCLATSTVCVKPAPGPTAGAIVCTGSTATLTNSSGGGTWTSVHPLVSTIDPFTGVAYGVKVGTALISYSLGGTCVSIATVTVIAGPQPITGKLDVCLGLTTLLSDATSGGTWSSGDPTIATVGSGGLVSGVGLLPNTGGVATISYTVGSGPTQCSATKVVTVNPLPSAITGPIQVCVSSSITVSDADPGGKWTSSAPAIASIGLTSGIITAGATAGTTTITYTLPTGCITTQLITVNALPAAIAGPSAVCVNSIITLSDATPGGVWSTASTTITVSGPDVTGLAPGGTLGIVTYTIPSTGCDIKATIKVNPLPAAITTSTTVCVGETKFATDATPGGTWSSGGPAIAIGSTTGVITGGSGGCAPIFYTLTATGCQTSATICVLTTPGSLSGGNSVCIAQTITLSGSPTPGTWASSNPFVAPITSGGVVTGNAVGTTLITYTIGTGCRSTQVVTVNPPPSAISGNSPVCLTSTLNLTDGTPGGTWSSSDPSVATIGSTSGVVTPGSVGTATITYFVGCPAYTTVTVLLSPKAITGPNTVCGGNNITLSDAISGGIWSSGTPAVAVATGSGPNTATVTGVAVASTGVATITYALGLCSATYNVTVNPTPVISGGGNVCQGSKLTLSSPIAGTWSSSAPTIASITSGGVVSGLVPGTTIITLTPPTGCIATQLVTVGMTPGVIVGPGQVCKGSTITLNNSVLGGTWTSPSGFVAVDPSSGAVTGMFPGTAPITYTLSSGCYKNTTVTVNPQPAAITGSSNICVGSSITLATTTPGVKWSTTSSLITSVGPTTGIVVAGGTPGTALITATIPATGCSIDKAVTINSLPAPITGATSICVGKTSALANSTTGTWASSTPAVATIVGGTGVATGISVGTTTITFTATSTGCNVMTTVTVFPTPGKINVPMPSICVGMTQTLTNSVTGGVWSSADPTIATLNPVTGLFTGLASGTVLVSYSVASGCTEITTVIVNPNSNITGNPTVCIGQSNVYVDTTLGGLWSATNSNVSITPTTGVATGLVAGTSVIVYTTTKGCTATFPVTVNTVPAGITGTPLPISQMCLGQNKAYFTSATGGTWSSSVPSVASITTAGVATGLAYGTSIISYTVRGCAAMVPVTINPIPAVVTGPTDVCVGQNVTMSDATPFGTWSSSRTLMAIVGSSSGIVTGKAVGTSTISYVVTATGCYANTTMNVFPVPLPVSGPSQVCVNSTITLTDLSPLGYWWSSNPAVATVSGGGVVLGITAGVVTIEYRYFSSGCGAQHLVTVNPLPQPINGSPLEICENETKVLTDPDAGGTWLSSTPSIATINATTGAATGIIAGVTTIDYTLPTGCSITDVMTVNPLPAAISGPASVCVGNIANYTNPTLGGNWSTDNVLIATADPANTGDVTGVAAGNVNVLYTLSATGCGVQKKIQVTDHPAAITGNPVICYGASNTFANKVGGGSWSTLNPTIASVNPTTGVVTGNTVGTTVLTYTMSAGCDTFVQIRVAPLPTAYTVAVSGSGTTCAGNGEVITQSGSAIGINYFLYVGSKVATGPLAGTGIPLNYGLQYVGGTYTVKATDANTGCSANMANSVVINVIPKVFPTVNVATATGDTLVCNGATVTLSATTTHTGSAPMYKWDINGTVVAITNAPYSYIPADGDVVTMTMTSNELCATPAIVSDKVTLKVVPPVTPSATLSTVPGDTICQGLPVTFTATPIYGGTKPTYTWYVNTVPVSTSATFTYVPVDLDIVYAKIGSNYPCLISATGVSNNVQMTVNPPLIPHVALTANPSPNVAPGQTVNLVATTDNGGTNPTYQWVVNGFPIAGATASTYAYTSSSSTIGHSDSISVVVTSDDLCRMTTHQWVYITIRNVGVRQVNGGSSNINVLPNPNKGEFSVKGSFGTNNDEEVSLELTDLLGQVVYKNKVLAKGGNIDTHVTLGNTLANGMYILSVRSESTTNVFHVVVEQ